MISKIKLTLLFTALFCVAGMNSLDAQTEEESKVTIKITYEDKEGNKHSETKELIGEEANKFDVETYEKELKERDLKLLTLDIMKKNVMSETDELHKSKDHNVFIMKKGSDDIKKDIKIIKESKGSKGTYFIEKSDVDEENVKKKRITITSLGDEKEGEEIQVEVKDGKIFINGEEVDESELKEVKEGNRVVIKSDDLHEDHDIHINKWVTEDGEKIELKGDGDNMIFISSDDDHKPKLGVMVEDGKEVNGAEVLDLVEDSPAAKAGIQKGDVLTAINGAKVYGVTSLLAAMQELTDDDKVEVTYVRGGKEINVDVNLEPLSEDHKMIKKKILKKKER